MSDTVYLFFYDGTPMTFTSDKGRDFMFQAFEELIPLMMKQEKTEIKVLNVMLNNLKILARKLYAVSDGKVSLKAMRKAWGEEWHACSTEWCMYVHCISKMSPAHVNNEFGMMEVTNAKKAFGKDYREYNMSACASCATTDVKQKKCGRCEAVHYCSPECQKAHWKTHKLTCVPLTK